MLARPLLQQSQPCADDLLAVPPAAGYLAWAQAGVLRRSQLRAAGMTNSAIDAEVRARRWRTLGRTVAVLGNAPLTDLQRQWAATLLVSEPVALAGPSAATAGGLTGFASPKVHIVVPHDTHTALPAWVKINESRRFSPQDVHRGSGPPRTSVARALVDTACWSTGPAGRARCSARASSRA